MNISIDDFKTLAHLSDAARVKVDGDSLRGTGKGFFLGRAISILFGVRQKENKAAYKAFKDALVDKYGALGKDVLSSVKPKAKTRLSSAVIKQVIAQTKKLDKQYRDLGVPYNDKTKIGEFQDHKLVGPMTELGSGALNTVYKGAYKLANGKTVDGVYKPETTKFEGWVGAKIGIDPSNPQWGRRNVATYQLAKLLGFDVVPRTEFGSHEGKLGVVMGLAPGTSPSKETTFEITEARVKGTSLERLWNDKSTIGTYTDKELANLAKLLGLKELRFEYGKLMARGAVPVKIDFDDPTLRKELTKLQWLDALCGQGDRHGQNYIVELNSKGKVLGVKGIDNDQSFGELTTDPKDLVYAPDTDHYGMWGCNLPLVIDTSMAEVFRDLRDHPEKLEEALTGLMTTDEIDACKQRLGKITDQIDLIENVGYMIDPKDWGETQTGNLLDGEDASYVGRDKLLQKGTKPVFNYNEVV